MKVGDLVRFNNKLRYPSRTGVVLGDRYFKRDGAMSKDDVWCEVLFGVGRLFVLGIMCMDCCEK